MLPEDAPPLRDDEHVYRIIYDPECVDPDDGSVVPAAVSLSDMVEGYSVNREFVQQQVVERLVADNMRSQPDARQRALVSKVLTRDVKTAKCQLVNAKPDEPPVLTMTASESPTPQDLDREPPFPANAAHAHITALHRGKGMLRKIRTECLVPLLQNPMKLDDFFGVIRPEPPADQGR